MKKLVLFMVAISLMALLSAVGVKEPEKAVFLLALAVPIVVLGGLGIFYVHSQLRNRRLEREHDAWKRNRNQI